MGIGVEWQIQYWVEPSTVFDTISHPEYYTVLVCTIIGVLTDLFFCMGKIISSSNSGLGM